MCFQIYFKLSFLFFYPILKSDLLLVPSILLLKTVPRFALFTFLNLGISEQI